jgi:hypothetical protein
MASRFATFAKTAPAAMATTIATAVIEGALPGTDAAPGLRQGPPALARYQQNPNDDVFDTVKGPRDPGGRTPLEDALTLRQP